MLELVKKICNGVGNLLKGIKYNYFTKKIKLSKDIKGDFEEFKYKDKEVVIFPIDETTYGLFTFNKDINDYVLVKVIKNYYSFSNLFYNGYTILKKYEHGVHLLTILTFDKENRAVVIALDLDFLDITEFTYISDNNNLKLTNDCNDAFKINYNKFIFNKVSDNDNEIIIVKGKISEFLDYYKIELNESICNLSNEEIINKKINFQYSKKDLPEKTKYVGQHTKFYTVTCLINNIPIVKLKTEDSEKPLIIIKGSKQENQKSPVIRIKNN
jgi:hypothetical protein